MQTILILGFGYTASYLAPELLHRGFEVIGTTRNNQKRMEFGHQNYHLIDFFDEEMAIYLRQATHVLISIPPEGSMGDPVMAHYGELIKLYGTNLKWLGYLSSTGVYGDFQGEWVNEQSSCHPKGRQGQLRLAAERVWLSCAKEMNLPLHLFRLAGIYGPGRSAIERIRAGKPYSIYKVGQYFSRIHVADIVEVVLASINAPNPMSIYNVADDKPAPSHEVDAFAAFLLEKAPPPLLPFEEAMLSPMEKEFYANNRRVSNEKIKIELKVNLNFPTYREGLASIVAASKASF
jgi:nucleoside-diphosphate-sugar epimerase